MTKGTTRRDFLQQAGGLAAMGAMGSLMPARLMAAADVVAPADADWPRYGYDLHNTRFNSKEKTLGPSNVDRLKVKWSFDVIDHFPIQTTPTVIGDSLFFGSGSWYYALDSHTGKLKWKLNTERAGGPNSPSKNGSTRGSCHYVDGKIYFGDGKAIVHCVDAASGREIWQTAFEPDPALGASMMYCVSVYRGKVYVADSSVQAKIGCMDAETGKVRWSWRVNQAVPPEAKTGGGAMWTGPGIDEKYNILYNATGDSKAFTANEGTLFCSSMVAHDCDTGELLWFFQPYPNDTSDVDMSTHPVIFDAEPPMFVRGDSRPCVVAGCKAGIYCLNRYTGQLYWKVMLGAKASTSGPQTNAIACAYNKIFVQYRNIPTVPAFAMTAALNAFTGDIEWMNLNPALNEAPLTVANGVLYQGFIMKPKVQALDVQNGRLLWEYDLPSDFRGGASIANGALYLSNGEEEASAVYQGKNQPYAYSVYCFTVDGK